MPTKVPVTRYWNLLSTYLRHRKWQFLVLAVLLLGGIGLELMIPQITRRFIDLAEESAPYRILVGAAAGFLVVSLFQQLVTVTARFMGETVAWNATNDLRLDLARHCLRLDMSFHNDRSPGEMIERVDGDLLTISQFFSQLVVLVGGSVLLLIGILIAFAIEDLRMGVVFAAFSGTTLYLFVRLRNIAVPFDKARRDTLSELFGYLEERLAGTEDIRSCGAVEHVLLGIHRIHYTLLGHWRKAELTHVTIRLLAGVMTVAGYSIALVGGYHLYQSGVLTIGGVYLVIHYTELLARPIRILTQQFQNLQDIGANVQRVTELFEIETKIIDPIRVTQQARPAQDHGQEYGEGREGHEGPVLPDGALSLRYASVTFGYKADEPVLKDVSLGIAPGEVLGVLGRTGSGKTTLARLVFRLYDPQMGSVELGGVPVSDIPLGLLRRNVAMVTQDVQLFQATVRENLTFFDRSVPDSRLHEVIDELGLRDWIAGLPKGLDSKLETSGRGLSAGEAQLLAFTRIFLRNPGLVILDEASSRLDPATEGLIERAVDRLLQGRSAVIIAHRLATVGRADSILVMDNGTVAEHGRRVELAADRSSRFHHLLVTGLEEAPA